MSQRVNLPAALVFDFDGLILDTEIAEYTSVAELFAELGANLGRDRWATAIGTENPDDFWLEWLESDLGRPVNRSLLRIEQSQRSEHQLRRLSLMPGVERLLGEAIAAGVPCGVASSSPRRWVLPHLDRLGLVDSFAAVVTREDAPQAKPAPDLYLVALDRLGVDRAHARRAIALEDSRNGSLAAVAAGLTCVVCPNSLTYDMDLAHAHHRVSSLAHLSVDGFAPLLLTAA